MTKHHKVSIALAVIYILVVCAFMISHRIWFSPDQFFVFALFGAVFMGRARLFILDWIPFLLLLFGYELLRGLVPFVSQNPHIFIMIKADQFLFGFIPTIKAQSLLYDPAHLHWYDYVLVTLYICHFIMPMIMGFIFWLRDRAFFKEYAMGLLILSYAAFVTFMLWPAMPPWMASNRGYLPPIKEVTGHVMSHFFTTPFAVPTIYALVDANPVAAMPSLHAAFPLIIFLFAVKKFRKLGLLLLPYVFGVWFAVIYLGEHYFVDVLAGAIYATVAFLIVEKKEVLFRITFLQHLFSFINKRLSFKKAATE